MSTASASPNTWAAVLFCSCDQPGVGAPKLQALSALRGEHGAKTLLNAEQELVRVSIPQAKWDLDAPEDIPLVAAAIGQE